MHINMYIRVYINRAMLASPPKESRKETNQEASKTLLANCFAGGIGDCSFNENVSTVTW